MTAKARQERVILDKEDFDGLLRKLVSLAAENGRLKARRGPTKRQLAAALRAGKL